MPYISQERRKILLVKKLGELGRNIGGPGELNYVITKIMCDFLLAIDAPYSYQELNELIGVLECAKQELYRCLVVPYEEQKIKENGDVYDK